MSINLSTKRKKKTISQLKKELWKWFALAMKRARSEDGSYVDCFTCGKPLEIGTSNCHLGHWLPKGGYSGHYFNEHNVRPQCYHCNISLSGNTAVFEYNLRQELGDELVNEIFETRHQSGKRDRQWYEEKIEHYKAMTREAAA